MYLLDKVIGPRPSKTVDGIIEWLETKPPTERYDYMDAENCVLGQYSEHRGERGLYLRQRWFLRAPFRFERAASGSTYDECGWTFGAALQRFKALKASL